MGTIDDRIKAIQNGTAAYKAALPNGAVAAQNAGTDAINSYSPTPVTTPTPVTPVGPAPDTSAPNYGYSPVTDFGKSYIDRISKTLSGQDPIVQNAKQSADTADSVSKYLARQSASQTSSAAGYTPGTLQSQRVQDRNLATADAANLNRDNSVNQLARDQGQSALTAATGIENDAKAQTENLISSVQDPKFQAYLRQVQARGGNVRQAYDQNQTNGTANVGVRSANPETVKLQGFVDQVHTEHPDWNDQQVQAEAQKRYQSGNQAINQPVTAATVTQTGAEIQQKVNTGNASQVDWTSPNAQAWLGQQPTVTPATIQAAGNAPKYVAANAGKVVTYNGKPVVVDKDLQVRTGKNHQAGGGEYYHLDLVQGKDPTTGSPIYIDPRNGKSTTSAPPSNNNPDENQKWLATFA